VSTKPAERIALVTTSYPTVEDDAAGHFVRAEARELARAGHDVHVVCPRGSSERGITIWTAGGADAFGTPGVVARLRSKPWRLPQLASFALGARRQLRRLGHLDRVVAHWLIPSAWPIALGCKAPLQCVAHGGDVRLLMRLPMRLRHHILRQLVDRGTQFRFAAHQLLDQLDASARAIVASQAEIHPPAIEIDDVVATTHRDFIVVVSRLVASKRVELAIDGAARCNAKLLIVGDGPERGRLEQRAHGTNTRFVGQRPRAEALGLIAAADVLLHPSAHEAAPTAIREARALGTPVICCAAGDTPRWAADDPAIMLAAATPDALASRLAELLDR